MHDTKADLAVRTTVSPISVFATSTSTETRPIPTDRLHPTHNSRQPRIISTLARHDCHRNDPGASPLPSGCPKHNSQTSALLLFGVANRQEERVSGCSGPWLTMFPGEHAHRKIFIPLRKHVPTTYPKLRCRECGHEPHPERQSASPTTILYVYIEQGGQNGDRYVTGRFP